jgi:putative tricarboxylic transport membrane protein
MNEVNGMGEKIANGFLFSLSTVYLIFAKQLTFGSASYPKGGFVPQVAGWLAVFVSGYLFVQSLRGKGDSKDVKMETDWGRLALLIISIIIYIIILRPVGYIISTILVLYAVLKIGGVKGWKLPGILSLCTSVVFYLIFNVALSVPLPTGILG